MVEDRNRDMDYVPTELQRFEPTRRQRIFGEVKEKAQKCQDRTQLCAAIYPWILDLVREYKKLPISQHYMDSFQNELNDFKARLSIFLSGIPFITGPETKLLDIERIRNEALDSAVDTALEIAGTDVCKLSINLSAIMASFVKDL